MPAQRRTRRVLVDDTVREGFGINAGPFGRALPQWQQEVWNGRSRLQCLLRESKTAPETHLPPAGLPFLVNLRCLKREGPDLREQGVLVGRRQKVGAVKSACGKIVCHG